MKNIIYPDRNNILIYFPSNKNGTLFEKIYTASPFSNIGSFSILKNTLNGEKIENRRILNLVIKRDSISSEMEIQIAGKAFCEFQENELAYYLNKEDYYFHELTLEELNLDINYTKVKKGKYPISITEEKISILFILRKEN
ncbi:hypothetical protein MCEGE10_01962 [Flavobacteriaceae bacterium]